MPGMTSCHGGDDIRSMSFIPILPLSGIYAGVCLFLKDLKRGGLDMVLTCLWELDRAALIKCISVEGYHKCTWMYLAS